MSARSKNSYPPIACLSAPVFVETLVGLLAVRESGNGSETLVLWPSILTDHTIYEVQIRSWANHHRVIVIDGPGHGSSGPSPERFAMADCARALGTILDALEQKQPVVVIGTSWGGLVGGEFALLYPERTRAVVMLNTPIAKPAPQFMDRFVAWSARWMHGSRLFALGTENAFFLPQTRAQGRTVLARFREHLKQANGTALSHVVRAVLIERESLEHRAQNILVPVLFVAGTHDTTSPLDMQRQAAMRLPRGRYMEVPAAHIAVVDAPEATLSAIDSFLSELCE